MTSRARVTRRRPRPAAPRREPRREGALDRRVSSATSGDQRPVPLEESARALRLPAGIAVCVLALCIWTLGVPPTLLLFGGLSLASGIGAWAPQLAGTASWAAGLLVEVATLSATSAATGLLGVHLTGRWENTAILLVPTLAGLAMRFARLREQPQVGRSATRFYQVVAGLLVVLLLGIFRWLGSLGTDYNVAWAMSGDARNEVLVIRSIIRAGGVTFRELRAFPAAMEGIMAQVSLAGGREHLAPGSLMLHDASTIAAFYIVAALAIALMSLAALAEVLPAASASGQHRLGLGIALLGAGMFALTPLAIGTSLDDGFVVAYTAIPILMACTVLTLRFYSSPSPGPVGIVGVTAIVLLFVWSVVAIVPAVLELAMLVYAARHCRRHAHTPGWQLASAIGLLCLAALVVVGVSQESRLQAAMAGTGAIIPPRVAIGIIIELAAVVYWIRADERTARWRFGSIAMAGGAVAAIIWGIHSLGQPPDGVYYSMKTLWVAASAFMWIGFLPLARAASDGERGAIRRHIASLPTILRETIKAATLIAAGYAVIAMGTTADNLFTLGPAGWFQPSAPVVAKVAAAGDRYRHFVLWDWAPNSADDRLGNFWADLVWGTSMTRPGVPYLSPKVYPPGLPDGLYLWAYSQDSDQSYSSAGLGQLCAVVRSVPKVVVITRLASLPSLVGKSCDVNGVRVVVDRGPS